MKQDLLKVQFVNKTYPRSAYDMLRLEELYRRESMEHDIEQLHTAQFFILIFITEGQGYHTIDFTDYRYEKGTILTIRKDQIHKFFKNTSAKGYILLFTDGFLVSYLEKIESQKTIRLFNEFLGNPKIKLSKKDNLEIRAIIDRLGGEYFTKMDDYSLGIIRSELHILITKLYRIKSVSNQIVSEKKYLQEFITLQELVEQKAKETTRVSDYAKMIGVSTKTLNNICKSIVNSTAKEFIDDVCTKQIKRLLINTTLSITEIAYESGFEEPTNFYKYFKRQAAMSPDQYRNSF